MAQTSYPTKMPVGFHGQLSDLRNNYCSTGVNVSSSVQLPFGIAVTKDASGDTMYRPPALSTEKVYGFIVHHQDVDILPLGSGTVSIGGTAVGFGVDVNREFTLMEEGNINVLFEQTLVAGAQVFVRYASGAGGSVLGAVRGDVDTASAALVKGAQVVTGAVAGQIGTISFSKLVNLS